MATKPSYIGLLNAIANGERGGHALFKSWANATKDKTLKPTLEMVSIREMEHSWAFEKRLCELGFSLRERVDPKLKKHVKLLGSDISDEKKFASFGVGGKKGDKTPPATDGLLQILADKSIDPQTGALIGRFICEERDTGRELQKAFSALVRRKAQQRAARKKKKAA